VVLGVETAKAPRSAHVLDWETGKLESWTVASAPEMETSRFAVARLEHYPARDGTQIPMFVRYPEGCDPEQGAPKGPCPVLVEFHGGPEGQAVPGFSARLQTFIDAGFIFAQPNVRGSDGYGKTWLDADNGPKRLAVITDIEDAARHLRQRLAKDGKAPRIGVYGGSYGGYSTLMAMTMFAGAYDVGVSVVGISDLRTFLRNTAPYRRQLRTSEYGDLEKDADALAKLSPSTYLEKVQDPLLLIQGVDDPRVPAGEAVQIYEAMKAKGLDAELILLAGEGHGAARRASQVMQHGHALRFFEEHLKEKKSAGAP
jgi:dipeptidyl aminopeptidase/acylaminoacyl peptidase